MIMAKISAQTSIMSITEKANKSLSSVITKQGYSKIGMVSSVLQICFTFDDLAVNSNYQSPAFDSYAFVFFS